VHGDERYGQAASVSQFGKRRVGMGEYVARQPLERLGTKSRFAPGIGRLGFNRARIAIAFENILHGPLGNAEAFGDLSHGLAVLQSRGYNASPEIY